MKTKPPKASTQSTSRIWIAALVVGAIAIVVGLKFVNAESKQQPKASVSATPVAEMPAQAPTSQGAAQDSGTPTIDQAQTAPVTSMTDPYPSDPAAQIDWVQRNKKPAMILFHSTSCIPCKQMEALVAQIRDDYEPAVYFIDVITNDKANAGLVRQAGIQAIPTTFFVSSEGTGVRNVGAMKEDALRNQLDLLKQGGL